MKKIIIVTLIVITILVIGFFSWYNLSLKSVSKDSDVVNFTIEAGTGTKQIIKNLKDANIIKSNSAALIYTFFNSDLSFKAGTFELNRDMTTKEILDKLDKGNTINDTIRITFKEGFTLKKYVEQIADAFDKESDELIKEINSKEFLESFIEEYWFLTEDILDSRIYYPLEGYLYPETYEFYKTAELKDIIKKMLDQTEKQLEEHKNAIANSKYSMHEILAMAAIIETEATSYEDRCKISQVIYKRLNIGMSLGMDVTSYYGARKDMSEKITSAELNDNNPYNTRPTSFKGLPIGPICNPSISSIKAALNPADTDYTYFVADMTTRQVYFAKDYKEFQAFKQKIYG